MASFRTVVGGPPRKTSETLTDEEKKEILDYLEAHSDDRAAIPLLMEKFNVSERTITMLVFKAEREVK